MDERFVRTSILLGEEAIDLFSTKRVAVFGVGGVGGYVVEALSRSGIGSIDIVDYDTVAKSNINRQIIALESTIGEYKVDVLEKRIHDINPNCIVNSHKCFYLPENKDTFDFTQYDYVVDAVDTITAKINIIEECQKHSVPVISSMGAGNKLNPTMFEVADIYKTSVCPLAKVMRRELKQRGIKSLKVVYSKEEPIKNLLPEESDKRKKTPGSISFVPSVVGLIIASEVIKDLSKTN